MYLVLIETAGNQAFIFGTNKLRENIGASELTYRVGTEIVLRAIEQVGGPKVKDDHSFSPRLVRSDLRNRSLNPPLESGRYNIEILTAASGKALLLVRSKEVGEQIIRDVTLWTLKKAPGLDVRGVISKHPVEEDKLHQAIKEVHIEHVKLGYRLPRPSQRFARMPVVRECQTSGLPASRIVPVGTDFLAVSEVSYHKAYREENNGKDNSPQHQFFKRIKNFVSNEIQLPKNINELEKIGSEWLAVIHADGNGLGEIFLQFHKLLGVSETELHSNRKYIEQFREFSLGLDDCTEAAFQFALKEMRDRGDFKSPFLPLVPLVLGGDDLTVICDGRYALQFTIDFLKEFERQTEQHSTIREIAKRKLKVDRLSACAGVAIVKPHYPFHAAYELSEALLKSAKQVKQKLRREENSIPCSALDYHVLYDTSSSDLESIRKKLKVDSGKTHLVARPYIVTPMDHLGQMDSFENKDSSKAKIPSNNWVKVRRIELLEKRIALLQARTEDQKRKLPNHLVHELRESLFLGHHAAEARLELLKSRYPEFGKLMIPTEEERLFWWEGENKITGFLDALDVVDFWISKETQGEKL